MQALAVVWDLFSQLPILVRHLLLAAKHESLRQGAEHARELRRRGWFLVRTRSRALHQTVASRYPQWRMKLAYSSAVKRDR
jgi:hypothetical protein